MKLYEMLLSQCLTLMLTYDLFHNPYTGRLLMLE